MSAKGLCRQSSINFKVECFIWGAVIRHLFGDLCQAAEELIWGTTVLTEELMEKHPKPTQAEVDFWANCERSHQFLGWSPLTSLETGIQKTWEWMQTA